VALEVDIALGDEFDYAAIGRAGGVDLVVFKKTKEAQHG
jgi:hypothetical protein